MFADCALQTALMSDQYEVDRVLDVTLNDQDKFKPYALIAWVGGREQWGDGAQTWEPVEVIQHLEVYKTKWLPRIKALQQDRAEMLEKANQELEELRNGNKRRNKSSISSTLAREMLTCSQLYTQRHPRNKVSLQLQKKIEIDDINQVAARLEFLCDPVVFERLNRSSFAGIHAELTEVFDQFEKEVRRAKAAESD